MKKMTQFLRSTGEQAKQPLPEQVETESALGSTAVKARTVEHELGELRPVV